MSTPPDTLHLTTAPGHRITRRRRYVALWLLILLAYLGIMFGWMLAP